MSKALLLHLERKRAAIAFERLRNYAETLEQLLLAKTAHVLVTEALSDISARSRNPALEPADASDELLGLQDSFPTILRGSLLPYVHGTFETRARNLANVFLKIPKGTNAKVIAEAINNSWPGTVDSDATQRLVDYKYLRHSSAHTVAEVSAALFDVKLTAKAASRTPGAIFRPLMPDSSSDRKWIGVLDFDATFLPEAIEFHCVQVERIAAAVEASLSDGGPAP